MNNLAIFIIEKKDKSGDALHGRAERNGQCKKLTELIMFTMFLHCGIILSCPVFVF